ncbi:MAG: GTPase ObgE [Bacilli bacterium]|jgi:GTP-binding protein
MFIDHAVIEVKAGKGGDGMIAFLHEKYMPKGGPSGGNGGRGGSIILRASKNVNTLYAFRHSKVILADEGGKGDIKNQYGRGAKDIYIDVPVGTVAYEEKTHDLIANLVKPGQEIIVAKGGRGGRGNATFKSASNRMPRIAENGLPGENKRLMLELKLIADVGLVGLPNAGKSTLLSVVSNANPEIADYPFTTIEPNLGVVNVNSKESFILADLPGLIEGASKGKGLGLEFLRHLERCKMYVHVVSMDGKSDPVLSYRQVRTELKKYGHKVSDKPEIIAASKMDEDEALEYLKSFKKKIRKPIIAISSLTHDGIDELMNKCLEVVSSIKEVPLVDEKGSNIEEKVYDAYKDESKEFDIIKVKDDTYRIIGDRVVRTYGLINLSTDEGVMKLITYLRKIGVDAKLSKMGAKDGDTILLEDFEFEYIA